MGLRVISGRLPSLVYAGAAKSTSNASSYTFNGVGIGPASSRRLVLVAVTSFGFTFQLSQVLIGGVAASVVIQNTGNGGTAWVALAVEAGDTANIQVQFNTGVSACLIEVYALYDLRSHVPAVTPIFTAGNPVNTTTDVPSRGIVLGLAASSMAFSWTGLSEDHEDSADGLFLSVAHYIATAAETARAITAASGANASAAIAVFR